MDQLSQIIDETSNRKRLKLNIIIKPGKLDTDYLNGSFKVWKENILMQ
jgi:hypothetical protein